MAKMLGSILSALTEEIAFGCEEGCEASRLWDLLQRKLDLRDSLLLYTAGYAKTRPDRLDKYTKAYCWEYIKRTRSITLFRNPGKNGNPAKASKKEPSDFDAEPEVLENLRSKGFECIDDRLRRLITWEQACEEGVIILADRQTRYSFICDSFPSFFLQSRDNIWLIIKEIAKSREKGLSQVDISSRFEIDSRMLYHYRKILNFSNIAYASYNENYIRFARICFWLNSGLDDTRLRQYMSEDQNVLIREDQYTLPIKSTILRILELSENRAMSKRDIYKTTRYAYKSVDLTQTSLSRIINILEKEGIVKVISISEPTGPVKNFTRYDHLIVQLIDSNGQAEDCNACYTPNGFHGVLYDMPLVNQVLCLILDSKEDGIKRASIASCLSGVKDRFIECCLAVLIRCSKLSNFPYEIRKIAVHVGKERMYAYSAIKKSAEINDSEPHLSLDEEMQPTKKPKNIHDSRATLTTMNRRKMFLEVVKEKKYIDRQVLHSTLQKNLNSNNDIHCIIDRKTIDRDAKFLCEKNLIKKYVATLPNPTGSPIIKFIYLLPKVSTRSDEFVTFIETLQDKTQQRQGSAMKPAVPVVKDMSFDKFSNWVNKKGLIERKSASIPAVHKDMLHIPLPESSVLLSSTDHIYSFVPGKMLRARIFHVLLIKRSFSYKNVNEGNMLFSARDAINSMSIKDIINMVQYKSTPALEYAVSRLLNQEEPNPALMGEVLSIIDPKIRIATLNLMCILESLRLIKLVDSSDADVMKRRYELLTNIPIINLLGRERVVVETIKLDSLKDAEYYWQRLQISCMCDQDLFKDNPPLSRHFHLNIDSTSGRSSEASWPHHPGYLFSSTGEVICAIWRRSQWASKRSSNKSDYSDIVVKHPSENKLYFNSTAENAPMREPKISNGIDAITQDVTPGELTPYLAQDPYQYLSRIPKSMYIFGKTSNGEGPTAPLSKRDNESMIYAIAILDAFRMHLDNNQRMALLMGLFADKFTSPDSAHEQIAKRLAERDSPFSKHIFQLTRLYLRFKTGNHNGEIMDALSPLSLTDTTVFKNEIDILRSVHDNSARSARLKGQDDVANDMDSACIHSGDESVATNQDMFTQKDISQHHIEDVLVPRVTPSVLMPIMYSKSFSSGLETLDLVDDYETECVTNEGGTAQYKSNSHESRFFCSQSVVKIISLTPSEHCDPIKVSIFMLAYSKQLMNLTLEYLWRKRTILRFKTPDAKSNILARGCLLSENFMTTLSGTSENLMFERARELYRRQIQIWNSVDMGLSDGLDVIKPVHTTSGGISLLLSELATSQIKLEPTFPEYILENIVKDTRDSLNYTGLGIRSKLLHKFGEFTKANNITNTRCLQKKRDGENKDLFCFTEPLEERHQGQTQVPHDNPHYVDNTTNVGSDGKSPTAHQKVLKRRTSVGLKRLYSEIHDEQCTLRRKSETTQFSTVDEAINSIAPRGKQHKLLMDMLNALDRAGSSGLTETDISYIVLQDGCDLDARKDLFNILRLSRRALIGDIGRSLVSIVGLSRVYYVSYKHSFKKFLRIPTNDLWVSIMESIGSDGVNIPKDSAYLNALDPNLDPTPRDSCVRLIPPRVWYDLYGDFRQPIWKSLCRVVASNIAKYPGVTETRLYKMMSYILTRVELREILEFLLEMSACRVRCFRKYASPVSVVDAIGLSLGKSLFMECNPSEIHHEKITYFWIEPMWITLL